MSKKVIIDVLIHVQWNVKPSVKNIGSLINIANDGVHSTLLIL